MSGNFDPANTKKIADVLWEKYDDVMSYSKWFLDENNQYHMRLNPDKRDIFCGNFSKRYQFVMENYMQDGVKTLDRHKVAAIAIIEYIRSEVLEYTKPPNLSGNEIFMPEYYMAAQVGLSFMQYWFNSWLAAKGKAPVKEWSWPKLISCPGNPYFSVFARSLYYTKERISWPKEEEKSSKPRLMR